MPVKFKEMPTTFYLGRRVDPETQKDTTEPVYYDSRDLTTHAVVVGMTGSGKTGLCISLLEDAILDNIPAIIIDPKGDITNLLLTFPQLRTEDFAPWVNVDDARREHMEPDQYAEMIAKKWREGLAEDGIVPGRIQALRNAAQFSIYTPGSDAGLPVSILDSLQTPREGWVGYEEAHRERINGTVTALLALIGKNADPVKDREHVLIANIFEDAWKRGEDLTLESIILKVQNPPFAKLGVFDIDTFFPQKERFKLAQSLNQIVAAPSFQTWMQGEPLDMRNLLYTHEGKPHVSIFYIAHLNDAERMFMITLLLENMLSWMRTLSGTTSLRALLYMDEVYGYFPPFPHNPPSKGPILRLLKQARAFGVGLVLATQNPVDLDYKGLANAGTWFIGKLQTDNDRKRMLGGLEVAASSNTQLDIKKLDKLITKLDQRNFVVNNVHNEEGPIVLETRWAMSYLRGPLTRQQVRTLMEPQRRAMNIQAKEFINQYTPAQGQMPITPPPLPGSTPASPLNSPTPAAGLFSGRKPGVTSSGDPGTTQTPRPFGAGLFQTGATPAVPPPPPTLPEMPGPLKPATSATPVRPPASSPSANSQYVERSFGAGLSKDSVGKPDLPLGLDASNAAASPAPAAPEPAKPANVPDGYSDRPASMAGNTAQYFLPVKQNTDSAVHAWEQKFGMQAMKVENPVLIYRPMLLAQLVARYMDRKSNVQEDQLLCYQVPDLDRAGFVNWDQYATLPVDPNLIDSQVPDNGWFGDIPAGLTDPKRLTALKSEMIDFVYRSANITLLYNSTLDLYGQPNETRRDYSIRLQTKAREARDAEIEKVTAKFDTELEKLDARLKKELRDHNIDLRMLEEFKREETYTAGEAVFGLMRGRPSYTLSRMSRTRRHKTAAEERAFANEQVITELEQELDKKQEELRQVLSDINAKWAKVATTIEESKLTPYKKDISLQLFGIGWVPAWSALINGQIVVLPAS